MQRVVNGIVLQNSNYLLVRKGDTYIFPGGKPRSGESDVDCLKREFRERLSGAEIRRIRPYGFFEGISSHKNEPIQVAVYLLDLEGKLGETSAEISERLFADKQDSFNISETTAQIIANLRKNRLLD